MQCCRSKGGEASGGTRPAVQALRANYYTFCSHLKTCLSRNLDQSLLKMRIFWKKTVKIASGVSRGQVGAVFGGASTHFAVK